MISQFLNTRLVSNQSEQVTSFTHTTAIDMNFCNNAARLFTLACVTIIVATHAEIKLKWAMDATTALPALI